MRLATPKIPVSKTKLWAGRIMSALSVLFLLFDGIIHIMQITPVVDSLHQLGYPVDLAPGIGIIELACVVLYVFPATSILGVILLTGYLGGAVAAHLRVGDPLLGYVLFPVYIGLLLWGGLYLRNDRLSALFPLPE